MLDRSRNSGIALSYGLDDRGFDSRQGPWIFIFSTAFRPALWSTQPPIQWAPGTPSWQYSSRDVKLDHSPPFSVEVKECVELYRHSPNTPSWRGAQLKHRDNFTFTFTFTFLMLRQQTDVIRKLKHILVSPLHWYIFTCLISVGEVRINFNRHSFSSSTGYSLLWGIFCPLFDTGTP
jgi:hypothetical protein